MANIASLLISIGMRVDGTLKVEQNLKSVQGEARKVATEGDNAGNRLGAAFTKAGSSLKGLVTVAVGAAVAIGGVAFGVYKFVKSQTDGISATVRLSKALGLNVEELQRLKHAAKFSGLSDESLASGMKRFNATLFDLEHSSGGVKGKGAAAALGEIGLGLKDLQGKSRTEQLGIIADRLNKVEDGATRSAIAAKLFGKTAGPEMMGLLAKGSEGIGKLAADAHVFTQEQADQAGAFNRSVKEISEDVGILGRDLALDLLPMVKSVVTAIRDWVHNNREWISQKIHEWVEKLANAFESAWPAVQELVKSIGELIKTLGDSGGLSVAVEMILGVIDALAVGLGTVARFVQACIDPFYSWTDAINDTDAAMDRLLNKTRALKDEGPFVSDKEKKGKLLAQKKLAEEDLKEVLRHLHPEWSEDQVAKEAKSGTEEYYGAKYENKKPERAPRPALAAIPAPPKRATRAATGASAGKAEPTSGVTVEDVISSMVHGGNPALNQRIMQNLAAHTPKAEDIKPTVAITYNNIKVDVVQHIRSTDPKEAGSESAIQIRDVMGRAHAKAAQSLGNNVVR